ncbi:MAG: acyl-CoA thioesterase [Proteobacteria bacterium]|nr:acyl-CoA thioesterase [Pseudomonadota bacterium]MBI3498356.1 acyl-CoA thioesterase [Pseudomonadota bacterium]
MSAPFSIRTTIRFSDCNAGGVVSHPNYFVMAEGLIEDWFAQLLALPFGELLSHRKIGLATVHLTVDIERQSRLGEALTWSLLVQEIGRSTIRLKISAAAEAAERISIQQVLMTVEPGSGKSVALPADLRVKVANYQTATAAKKA